MYLFTRPSGGLYLGKRLLNPPTVTRVHAGAPGKIAFVADPHIRPNGAFMADTIAKQVAALRPNLVLLGGDYGEYDEGETYFFESLASFLPGTPMFAVPGNNDDARFGGDREYLFGLMRKCGVTPLINECARVTVNGTTVEIAGVDDAYLHEPSAKDLFSGGGSAYRVLLSHAPHRFLLDESAPDLMLAGHTHGGQINVCGLTCYVLIRYEPRFKYTHIAGVKRVGNTVCVVSRGIGTSKFPIRFGARPEIHLID